MLPSEVQSKVRQAIEAKLAELGTQVDSELPDYIMILVANNKNKSEMQSDLRLFLNDKTDSFVAWLDDVLEKIKLITAVPERQRPIKNVSNGVQKAFAPSPSPSSSSLSTNSSLSRSRSRSRSGSTPRSRSSRPRSQSPPRRRPPPLPSRPRSRSSTSDNRIPFRRRHEEPYYPDRWSQSQHHHSRASHHHRRHFSPFSPRGHDYNDELDSRGPSYRHRQPPSLHRRRRSRSPLYPSDRPRSPARLAASSRGGRDDSDRRQQLYSDYDRHRKALKRRSPPTESLDKQESGTTAADSDKHAAQASDSGSDFSLSDMSDAEETRTDRSIRDKPSSPVANYRGARIYSRDSNRVSSRPRKDSPNFHHWRRPSPGEAQSRRHYDSQPSPDAERRAESRAEHRFNDEYACKSRNFIYEGRMRADFEDSTHSRMQKKSATRHTDKSRKRAQRASTSPRREDKDLRLQLTASKGRRGRQLRSPPYDCAIDRQSDRDYPRNAAEDNLTSLPLSGSKRALQIQKKAGHIRKTSSVVEVPTRSVRLPSTRLSQPSDRQVRISSKKRHVHPVQQSNNTREISSLGEASSMHEDSANDDSASSIPEHVASLTRPTSSTRFHVTINGINKSYFQRQAKDSKPVSVVDKARKLPLQSTGAKIVFQSSKKKKKDPPAQEIIVPVAVAPRASVPAGTGGSGKHIPKSIIDGQIKSKGPMASEQRVRDVATMPVKKTRKRITAP